MEDEKIINSYIEELKNLLDSEYRKKVPTASGKLKKFTSKVEYGNNCYKIIFDLPSYWYYVEKGRKSGKFPPINKIEEWVKIKPIIPTSYNGKIPTTKQLSFLIARKIAKKGTKPQNTLEKVFTENKSEIEIILKKANQKIIKSIFDYMNKNL